MPAEEQDREGMDFACDAARMRKPAIVHAIAR